jgi:ADP-ribose pyrophosphatase YjhB (NUDIX family)
VSEEPVLRPAARVLLLDPDDRVLLVRLLAEDGERSWWTTPGGGVQPGETPEQAALREVREETGLAEVALGPCVWLREHVFPWLGRTWRQQERFYVARVAVFEPVRDGLEATEAAMLGEHRWWSVEEIERSSEDFGPRRLAFLLRTLLTEGPPPEPLRIGV